MTDAEAAAFFDGDWFIQWQTETKYLKAEYNKCVKATYRVQPPSFFRYTVAIHNVAKSTNTGDWKDSNWLGFTLLGAQRHPDSQGLAKFLVAPHFLPSWFAGDYWIIAHDNKNKDDEFAVVCGGQPTIAVSDGYTYDTNATNRSGLWIFTRHPNPTSIPSIYKTATEIIRHNGISLHGLARVTQCDDCHR